MSHEMNMYTRTSPRRSPLVPRAPIHSSASTVWPVRCPAGRPRNGTRPSKIARLAFVARSRAAARHRGRNIFLVGSLSALEHLFLSAVEYTQAERSHSPYTTCSVSNRDVNRSTPKLTNDSDKPKEELIQGSRPLPDSQGHCFQVVLEENAWNSFVVLKGSGIVRDGVLNVSANHIDHAEYRT